MFRTYIADTDIINIKKLSRFLVQKNVVVPEVWHSKFEYYKFLNESENAIVFIRVDNYAISGFELTKSTTARSPNIHIVWMAGSDAYAVEAFRYGAEAYLLIPATENAIGEIIDSINRNPKRTKGEI